MIGPLTDAVAESIRAEMVALPSPAGHCRVAMPSITAAI